ncbi:MAG: general stress protein [Galbitalea sp.]
MPTTATDIEQKNSTIAVYPTSEEVLRAADLLRNAGYGDESVSIIGKGVKQSKEIQGWIPAGSRAGTFGEWGSLWGALTGWLLLGFVWIPGIGWVATAGWLVAALAGSGVGAGLGALSGLAVPGEEVAVYENELKADRYLVIVRGDGIRSPGPTASSSHDAHSGQFLAILNCGSGCRRVGTPRAARTAQGLLLRATAQSSPNRSAFATACRRDDTSSFR